ncbi:MAG TPA: hypothetical protein VL092_02830 [Chitinophagaceae bacterium]|nr:hypothetical protein [Chitinophagaceae bacterium]
MKQLLYCAILMLSLASCTKSSTQATENSEILRSGKWQIKEFTVKYTYNDKDSVYDIYRNMDTCRLDDYLTFGEAYHGAQFSEKKKCGGELDEMPFDWKLMDNQKILVMNNAQYTIGAIANKNVFLPGMEYVEAKIQKINKKSMTITYSNTLPKVYFPRTPLSDTGIFVSMTYYFTQTFEKM